MAPTGMKYMIWHQVLLDWWTHTIGGRGGQARLYNVLSSTMLYLCTVIVICILSDYPLKVKHSQTVFTRSSRYWYVKLTSCPVNNWTTRLRTSSSAADAALQSMGRLKRRMLRRLDLVPWKCSDFGWRCLVHCLFQGSKMGKSIVKICKSWNVLFCWTVVQFRLLP